LHDAGFVCEGEWNDGAHQHEPDDRDPRPPSGATDEVASE
jgi:hypothetical protein